MVRLMGIDPGLRFTGWGVIAVDGNRLTHVADGVIATDSDTGVPLRLKMPSMTSLTTLFAELPAGRGGGGGDLRQPQRRGDAEARLCPRRGAVGSGAGRHSRSWNMGRNRSNSAVVGTGGASKEQVEMMVRRLLPGATLRRADASDALAVAICHAHHRSSRLRVASGMVMA